MGRQADVNMVEGRSTIKAVAAGLCSGERNHILSQAFSEGREGGAAQNRGAHCSDKAAGLRKTRQLQIRERR